MGALIPRVMFPGSLAAAAREAGAEPLWTGRPRAYAESTLRLAATRLDRVMEPHTLFELLLGRTALTCVEAGRLTMWVDALDGADDRARQAALVAAFNHLKLRCRGREVVIHLREMLAEKAA